MTQLKHFTQVSRITSLLLGGMVLSVTMAYSQAMKVNSNGHIGINSEPSSGNILRIIGETDVNALDVIGDAYFSDIYPFNVEAQNNLSVANKAGIGCSWSSGNSLKVVEGSEINALRVEGTIKFTDYPDCPSDKRLKKNISSFDHSKLLKKMQHIEGKQFEFKNREKLKALENSSNIRFPVDTIRERDSLGRVKSTRTRKAIPQYPKGKQFGFSAQAVKKVFPELVRLDSTDMTYGIKYTGFIPILFEIVKDQQSQLAKQQQQIAAKERTNQQLKDRIETLEQQVSMIQAQCCAQSLDDSSPKKKSATVTSDESTASATSQDATLAQNAPNPFTERTQIQYYLPETTSNANLYIYDMQGNQIKQYAINATGNGSITIHGGELEPGMYMYSLIADGREVDTKRMILTE
jgi:hypothetical protein